jgi:hypothetical protein
VRVDEDGVAVGVQHHKTPDWLSITWLR